MNIRTESIYFVYIGERLPMYAKASIEMAYKMSGLRPHLIANISTKSLIDTKFCDFTAIEWFYDEYWFRVAKSKISSNSEFRGGFWLKTLERFFVLSQFARHKNLNTIFHAELDQVLFGIDRLVNNLKLTGNKGIFVPFHAPDSAVASVFYINRLESLDNLLYHSTHGDIFPNEMALIARWASLNPSEVYSLPTLASVLLRRGIAAPPNVYELTIEEAGGIVDAAQLGSWVFGIDPRNVPIRERPETKFIDKPSEFLLSETLLKSVNFNQSDEGKNLYVTSDKYMQIPLYNLHLHAKLHHYLVRDKVSLNSLLVAAGEAGRLKIKYARRIQVHEYFLRLFVLFWSHPKDFFWKCICAITKRF